MFYATASHFEEYYPNMGRAFYKVRPACPASRSRSALAPSCPHPRQACTEPECDVILVTAMTISLGLDLGEALHKPVWACKLAPDIPTRAYPPPGMTAAALPIGNLLKHYLYWGRVGGCRLAPFPSLGPPCSPRPSGSPSPQPAPRARPTSLVWRTPSDARSWGWGAYAARSAAAGRRVRLTHASLSPFAGMRRLKDMGSTPYILGVSPTLMPKPQDWPASASGALPSRRAWSLCLLNSILPVQSPASGS